MSQLGKLKTASKATRIVALAAALLSAAGISYAVGAALAAPSVPTPAITGHPSNPTNQTSATFTYTDSSSVNFLCSLDGGKFAACRSGKSGSVNYSDLAEGLHTVRVEAQSGSNTSAAASFSWIIALTAPKITLTFPVNGGLYNAAAWNAGCAGGGGICGSASDLIGVSSVRVSVRQTSSGKYWGGSSFSSSTEVFNLATLMSPGAMSTSWRYPLVVPQPDGSYTVHVRASDLLGNTTPAASQLSATFALDTTPPPPPTLTDSPDNPTTVRNAQFRFTDSESGVSFQCMLDGGSWSACGSPQSYNNLADGTHTFRVRTIDAAGNPSSPTTFTWTIFTPRNFGIAGGPVAGARLYPGAQTPINLVLSNPNPKTITVTSVTTSIASTSRSGCATSNFSIAQQLSTSVNVPPNSTMSLQQLNVAQSSWPKLRMVDAPTNQDICKGAVVTLSYTGTDQG